MSKKFKKLLSGTGFDCYHYMPEWFRIHDEKEIQGSSCWWWCVNGCTLVVVVGLMTRDVHMWGHTRAAVHGVRKGGLFQILIGGHPSLFPQFHYLVRVVLFLATELECDGKSYCFMKFAVNNLQQFFKDENYDPRCVAPRKCWESRVETGFLPNAWCGNLGT